MLVGREPAERLGYAARAEPAHPGVELGHEPRDPDALPVPRVEELLLENSAKLVAFLAIAPLFRGNEPS